MIPVHIAGMLTDDDDKYKAVVEAFWPGATIDRIWPLTGGVSAVVNAVSATLASGAKGTAVVRFPAVHGAKPASGCVAEVEFRLLRCLFGAGIPVPEPLWLDTSGAVFEVPFFVERFVEGSTAVACENIPTAVNEMARQLVDIHNVAGEFDVPLLEDPVQGALAYLPPDGAVARAVNRRGLIGANDPTLLHGDYWPGNIIWEGTRIMAVIDWEDAVLGDPVADLATATLELRWRYDSAAADAFLLAYLDKRDIDVSDLAVWRIYAASAALAYMDRWGLEPALLHRMRDVAKDVVDESFEEIA